LDMSCAPDPDTKQGVSLGRFEFASEIKRSGQSVTRASRQTRVILLPGERLDSLRKLHRRAQLVRNQGMPPLAYQRRIKEQGTLKGTTELFCALVACLRFGRLHSSRHRKIERGLRQYVQLILRGKRLPAAAQRDGQLPVRLFEEMNQHREQRSPGPK